METGLRDPRIPINQSDYTPSCFNAITTGVMKRLTKLTSISECNKNTPLDELYPLHFEALKKADLLKNFRIRTTGEKKEEMEKEENNPILIKHKKRRGKNMKRAVYFKIGFIKILEDTNLPCPQEKQRQISFPQLAKSIDVLPQVYQLERTSGR